MAVNPELKSINRPILRRSGPNRRRCICISPFREPTHLENLMILTLENGKKKFSKVLTTQTKMS